MSENIYYVDKTKLKTTTEWCWILTEDNEGTGMSSVHSEIGVTSTGTKHPPPQKICFDSTMPVEHSFQSKYYI
jgi:hypothetical protein